MRYNLVSVTVWRDGRVAEGARLESVYRLIPYRGFESPSLRHYLPEGTRLLKGMRWIKFAPALGRALVSSAKLLREPLQPHHAAATFP